MKRYGFIAGLLVLVALTGCGKPEITATISKDVVAAAPVETPDYTATPVPKTTTPATSTVPTIKTKDTYSADYTDFIPSAGIGSRPVSIDIPSTIFKNGGQFSLPFVILNGEDRDKNIGYALVIPNDISDDEAQPFPVGWFQWFNNPDGKVFAKAGEEVRIDITGTVPKDTILKPGRYLLIANYWEAAGGFVTQKLGVKWFVNVSE